MRNARRFFLIEELLRYREVMLRATLERVEGDEITCGPIMAWCMTTENIFFQLGWLRRWSNSDLAYVTVSDELYTLDYPKSCIDIIGVLPNGNLGIQFKSHSMDFTDYMQIYVRNSFGKEIGILTKSK